MLHQILRANKVFKINIDYIVKNNSVYIIDEFTGRITSDRRYSDGLHQAIEAKEGVNIQGENQTLSYITFQNYFRMYRKLSGMTGTAMTESREFLDIYKLQCVKVPTNKKIQRIDRHDSIYKTSQAKYNAIVEEIKIFHKNKQPILIGTTSIEKSEYVSKLLYASNIKHNVLNAKHHQKEADIISQAGRLGSVTITTNMAGRGTDIKLGGNVNVFAKQIQNNLLELLKLKKKNNKEKKEVVLKGGLYVIITERHESRRVDNQLRGRSGRQGDPGMTKFFISLEDDLMRIFGSRKIVSILSKLGLKDSDAIEHPWINRSIEKAQKKVENRNYEIRKTLLKYDNVINDQRVYVYKQRIDIMGGSCFDIVLEKILKSYNKDLVEKFVPLKSFQHEWSLNNLVTVLYKTYKINFDVFELESSNNILRIVNIKTINIIKLKKKKLGRNIFNEIIKRIFLSNLDYLWKNHIYLLDKVKNSVNLRAYGQKNPLNEYKFEALMLFEYLFISLKEEIIYDIVHIYEI